MTEGGAAQAGGRERVRVRWWLSDPDLPALVWCRLRVHADGVCDVLDSDGILQGFSGEQAARNALLEDEFVEADSELLTELRDSGIAPSALQPPNALDDGEPARLPVLDCGRCGARWSDGFHNPDCEQCGGGALARRCLMCGGACGSLWHRAVLDSQDSGEAHWLGACTAKCRSCGAEWGKHRHTPGCPECGGGALLFPCPRCGGSCGPPWRRDVAESWRVQAAHWIGQCLADS